MTQEQIDKLIARNQFLEANNFLLTQKLKEKNNEIKKLKRLQQSENNDRKEHQVTLDELM